MSDLEQVYCCKYMNTFKQYCKDQDLTNPSINWHPVVLQNIAVLIGESYCRWSWQSYKVWRFCKRTSKWDSSRRWWWGEFQWNEMEERGDGIWSMDAFTGFYGKFLRSQMFISFNWTVKCTSHVQRITMWLEQLENQNQTAPNQSTWTRFSGSIINVLQGTIVREYGRLVVSVWQSPYCQDLGPIFS